MIALVVAALLAGVAANRLRKSAWFACRVRGQHVYGIELRWYPPGHPNHFGQTNVLAKCLRCPWWYTSTYDGRVGDGYRPHRGIVGEVRSFDMGRARTHLDLERTRSGIARGSFGETRAALG